MEATLPGTGTYLTVPKAIQYSSYQQEPDPVPT